DESDDRAPTGRRRGARPRRAPDVSDPVGLRQHHLRPDRRRRRQRAAGSLDGDLRRQRDDRMPDGSVPAGHGRRRRPQARRRAETRRDDALDDRRPELPRNPSRRGIRPPQLRCMTMRTIKTTTGAEITLDGDLLAIMETLYREVTARRALERSFEDMVKEINHLIGQMDDQERRNYLAESLF